MVLFKYVINQYPNIKDLTMKKLMISVLFASVLMLLPVFSANATEYTADSDGKYSIEIETDTPNTEFAIVVVAGDYTGKTRPQLSADNIIYINQVKSDSDGKVFFEDFIPMTDSVGTVFISGDIAPQNEGVLMTESGFGYIAGKLISYTGDADEIYVGSEITSVGADVLDNAPSVKRVFLHSAVTAISESAFGAGVKLFISPKVTDNIRQYAIDNGLTYYVLGDYDNDKNVDGEDMQGILSHYAEAKTPNDDFEYYFDLNFDGKVNLLDASVLLRFLGGVIDDFLT